MAIQVTLGAKAKGTITRAKTGTETGTKIRRRVTIVLILSLHMPAEKKNQ